VLVGLDGIPLSEAKTGVGHYTFELARALAAVSPADEFEIVSPRPFFIQEEREGPPPRNLRMVRAEVNALTRHWWTVGLRRHTRRRPFTIFHGTNYEVPLWKSCPTVMTVHDLSLLLHAQTHEAGRVRRARRRLPLMARAATMILTPTESVRREVCETLGAATERVIAVPEAARRTLTPLTEAQARPARERLGVEDEFLLFVGTIEPRKNLRTLVRAFAEILRSTTFRPQLVIAGKKGWLTDELFVELEASPARDRVLFTGYVSDEDLRALYSSSLSSTRQFTKASACRRSKQWPAARPS
jgi:glycosyltransferase involved in cell wall biosynthesis